MSYSNRVWVYGPVGLLLLIVILYSIFWRVQSDMLEARLDGANGGEILPGLVFTFANKTVGGYPFRLDAVLDGVALTHAGADGPTVWRSEKLALHALTYGRALFILEAAGIQSFETPGAPGMPAQIYALTPAIARASTILRDRRLARFDLDLWQAELKDVSQGAPADRTLSAARAQLHFLSRAGGTIDVAARFDETAIGAGFHPVLGDKLTLADLRGQLSQGESFAGLEGGGEGVFEASERWRSAGGRLNVQSLALDLAGTKTELSGTLALDENHKLDGTLHGSLDAAKLIGALTRGGVSLTGMGEAEFSLVFKNGDIAVKTESLAAPR